MPNENLTHSSGLPPSGVTGTALVAAAIGTTVQAYSATLATWSGITPGTGVGTAMAVAVGSVGAVVVNGGAGGTPSSLTLTNATGLPTAGVVGITRLGQRHLTAKNIVPVNWFANSSGLVGAGAVATKVAANVTGCEIHYINATAVGKYYINRIHNFGAGTPYAQLYPGTRGAVSALPTNATIDWDQPWTMAWSGTTYIGGSGGVINIYFGASYGNATEALIGKGLRIKFTATGGGATDGVVTMMAYGSAEFSGILTGAVSPVDFTTHSWLLDWIPGVGAYLYRDGTLVASCLAAAGTLPSGTGPGHFIDVGMIVGTPGTQAVIGTIEGMQNLWQ